MQLRSGIVFCVLLATALTQVSQSSEPLKVERVVSGQTLTSMSNPRITLQFAPSFRYAGGQAFDLLGIEVAEEHLFVVADPGRSIQRFFWVQFEHYLPSSDYKIDYSSIRQQPLRLGPITFLAHTRIGRDYFTSDKRARDTVLTSLSCAC